MSDLFTTQQARQFDAVSAVSRLIATGDLDRKVLNEACNAAFNGSNANGAWSQRDSFEIMEQGLVHHARTLEPITSIEQIAILDQLSRALPTQTVRSEDQIRFQQFSTPLELAGLMILLAQPKPSDTVLEPSAGNGALVAMLPKVKGLHLNELDGKRKAILEMQFTNASVTSFDGAMLSAHLPKAILPTLILMNPPFARSEGRGKDRYAAVRHLRSAISRLAANGRVVAIMPEWFVAEGPMRKIYEATFDGCTVAQSYLLQKSYLKQGTSIAIRLLVIDKRPGPNQPMVIQGESVAKIASKIVIPARRTLPAPQPATLQPGQASISLFKAARSGKTSAVPLSKPRVSNAAIELNYTSLETPRPLGKQSGVYLPYRPSRLDICNAAAHPTALVESVAMGSIPAPVPDYRPKILERVLRDKLVSEAQLETLIYAGTAWSQFLPGRYKPDEEGVGLSPKEDGDQYRKGYFLGDGTGAGKGRQIAICILDSWLSGRRRNIWVSKNESLLEDARRDWQAIGGLAADIQPLSGWKIDEPITMGDGILFITFPTLRSQRQDATRLRQVLNWAGSNYEGIMAFDESHEMGGVAGGEGALGKTKGSQQGIAGVRLQNHLPLARVLYASATGASDVNNLAYAVRLGLWGEGTSFANRENFISEIRAGGIAAMELVSRDLKALGLYQARALSFAGVEYEVLKHPLSESQIQIYDAYADAWTVLCAARHNSAYREEAVMRRNAA